MADETLDILLYVVYPVKQIPTGNYYFAMRSDFSYGKFLISVTTLEMIISFFLKKEVLYVS